MLCVLRFSTKTVDTQCFVASGMLLVQCWCHHHMAQLQCCWSQSKHVLFSPFLFCYLYLYARTVFQQRAQKQGSVWHDRPACEVSGALCGIENGAKMWSLFAVRANVLKGTLRFCKLHRFKVIDQIYIIVLFLFSNSMLFIRYLRRSEEKKRCHGDNNVALEATVWCIALQKWCLCNPTHFPHMCRRST